MTNPFEDIKKFHEQFGLAYFGPPRVLDEQTERYRDTCALEEITEMSAEGVTAEQRFDAHIDLIYFLLGTCYLHGWDFHKGWKRVHEANMKKQRAKPDGSDSKRGSPLDVVKPAYWTHPSLADLV